MASISVVSKYWDSIRVKITGLDSSYSYNNRQIEWYIDGDLDDTVDLDGGVSSSDNYTFYGLHGSTTYTIGAIITGITGTGDVELTEIDVTTSASCFMEAVNKSTTAIEEVYPDQEYEVAYNETVYFQANMIASTEDAGYVFRGWYTSSTSVSDSSLASRDNPYRFKLTEDTVLYARARSTELTTVEKTHNSITVKLTYSYDYGGSYDYRINVYDTVNEKSILSEEEISYDDVSEGYTITGLDENTTYAINIGYIPGDYADDIIWIWKSGYAPEVTTNLSTPSELEVDVYIQNADDNNYSYTTYFYYSAIMGSTVTLSELANTVLGDLKDTSLDLFNHIEYDSSTVDGDAMTSFEVEDTYYSVAMYFDRKTYTLTLTKGTGISNILINNTTPQSKYKYNQTLVAKATLSTNYSFDYWHSNPAIDGLDYSTDNPSISFQMPGQTLSLQAVGKYVTPEYTFKLWVAYENADDNGTTEYKKIDTTYEEGESVSLSSYKETYAKTGFTWSETKVNDNSTTSSSITISQDTIVYIYYTRNVWTLTLKGGTGVDSFSVNGVSKNLGASLPYKYEQTVTIQAVFKENYSLDYWSSSQISGLSGNPVTINMPNSAATITVYAKVGIANWEWENYEIEAFEGQGAFSTLTADRWNEFLDWCNEVLTLKGKTTIGSAYYGEKNQPLYASDFNYIIDRLEAVATIPSAISSTKSKGDIIKGSYFIDIADAMNDVL